MASPISEVVSHSVTLEHSGAVITIELIGHKSTDSYATNLNLTGSMHAYLLNVIMV